MKKILVLLFIALAMNVYGKLVPSDDNRMVFSGKETITGTLIAEWLEDDYYNDLEYGKYYRAFSLYIIPDKQYVSILPKLEEYKATYKDSRIFLRYYSEEHEYENIGTYDNEEEAITGYIIGKLKKIYPKMPPNFLSYEGGSVSMKVSITFTNFITEVYPGGGQYYEYGASITDIKKINESDKSFAMKTYKEDIYPLLSYKTKDEYINIRDKPSGKVIGKVYKNTFKYSDIKVLQIDIEGEGEGKWYKVLYFDRDKKDYFLGWVHKSQVSLDENAEIK